MRHRAMIGKLLVAIAAGVLLAPAAGARDRGWGYVPQAQGQQAKKGPPQPERGGGKEFRREERQPRDERQQGRMTEEERRELHRDLDRANREIYRQKRGR